MTNERETMGMEMDLNFDDLLGEMLAKQEWEAREKMTPEEVSEQMYKHHIEQYGQMREEYLWEYRNDVWMEFVTGNTLWRHLREIDDAAQRRMDTWYAMAKKVGATEEMKNSDPLQWIGIANNCRARIEELILHELVYV